MAADEHEEGTALGALLKAKGFQATPPVARAADDLSGAGKIVLRRERKGRGGKTVTVVSGLALSPARLAELARALRKGLGCGSTVEGETIVLQGDIADRTQQWLIAHGATKIVRGS